MALVITLEGRCLQRPGAASSSPPAAPRVRLFVPRPHRAPDKQDALCDFAWI